MPNSIKQIFIDKILKDDEVSKLEGTWIDKSYIKHPIIKEKWLRLKIIIIIKIKII